MIPIGGGMQQQIADASYQAKPLFQTLAPSTGNTVSAPNVPIDSTTWIAPSGTLLNLTFNLPSDANSRLGQLVAIGFSKIITNLVLANASNIGNPIISAAINDLFTYKKVAADTWTLQ